MKFVRFGKNNHKFITSDILRFRDEEISNGKVVMDPTTSRDNTKNLSRHLKCRAQDIKAGYNPDEMDGDEYPNSIWTQ